MPVNKKTVYFKRFSENNIKGTVMQNEKPMINDRLRHRNIITQGVPSLFLSVKFLSFS